uniref:Ig-like domain-containing protein n=1 Tax=Latimeria chalumnae TaxID=7897 RepID=H2ZXI3_LATCH
FMILIFSNNMLAPIQGQQIHSILGKDITMKCKFYTNKNLNYQELQIYWYLYRKEDSITVHCFINGADQCMEQDSSFRGRTQLSFEEINQKIISLIISNVKISDSGTYQCVLIEKALYKMDMLLTLLYHTYALNNSPYEISQRNPFSTGEESLLQCEAKGGYPKGKVTWTTEDGQEINQTISTSYSLNTEGCFDIFSNLSLTLQRNTTICCSVFHIELFQKMDCREVMKLQTCSPSSDNDLSYGRKEKNRSSGAPFSSVGLLGLAVEAWVLTVLLLRSGV